MTFVELVLSRAEDPATAAKVMARHDDRTVTYAEYARESSRWARMFLARRRDAAQPPRVAVLMRNRLEFLAAYGGTALCGGQLFGVNVGLGGEVLARVIERSSADVVLVDDTTRESTLAAGIAPDRVVAVEDAAREAAALADTPPDLGDASPGPTTPWVVIYTSGTTGVPKGIVNTHG